MDQTIDQNPVALYRVDQLAGTPDFVMDSPVLTREDCSKYASTGFADAARREFPIFNKAATWTSYAYLKGSGIRDAVVEFRIKKAAEAFGISEDLKKIDSALASQVKSASADESYALPAGSIPEHAEANVYSIKTAFDIENSARSLLNDRSRMSVQLFYKAATAITKAASSKGVEIPAAVKAAGTLKYPDFAHAAKIAEMRRIVVKNPEALELYSEAVKSASADNALDVTPFIDVWFELDRAHGVKYANGILDPYAAFYAGPTVSDVEKAASEHVFILDVAVPSSVVAKISDETIADNFSKSSAEKLQTWRKAAAKNGIEGSAQIATFSKEIQKDVLRLALAVG